MLEETATFVLPLNSATGYGLLIDNSNKSAVRFGVNWDSFFNGMNDKYRRCRLRYKFTSNGSTTYTAQAQNSMVSLVGMVSKSAAVAGGLVLGPALMSQATGASNEFILMGDDISAVIGQDIVMPKNRVDLTVNLNQLTAFGGATNTLTALTQNWVLMLYFELYDPIV